MGSEEGWGVSWYVLLPKSPRVYVYIFSFTYLTTIAEVKALKSLVRNVIAPERDLGHTDRALKAQQGGQKEKTKKEEGKELEDKEDKDAKACEDCQ
jgi:hypothetical protein